MVPPNSHRVLRAPWYLGSEPKESRAFTLQDCHLLWCAFPDASVRHEISDSPPRLQPEPVRPHDPDVTTPAGYHMTSVWAVPFSFATTGGIALLSLPTGTEMFQFPALASVAYGFSDGSAGISRRGLPHSGISGLASVCDYPELIAAYHALHRLLVPRHPPCTLSSLTPL